MTYKHLTTREFTLIADFGKVLRLIKLLSYSSAVKKPFTGSTVFWIAVKQLSNTLKAINAINSVVVVCTLNYQQLKLTISILRLKSGWTPDTIIGRGEHHISCSMRTLYRMFNRGEFDVHQLPMKGKSHPNGYIETRGRSKAGQLDRSIDERYPNYRQEFGHLTDTVQGHQHHGAVMTLVERISKVEIILNTHHRTAECVNRCLDEWLTNGTTSLI